jgi:type IV pilus assembly protein PilY1
MKSFKTYTRALLFFFPFFFFLTMTCFAYDTDLYTSASAGVEPNLLIIIDTSCSMLNEINTGNDYDPAITYSTHPDYPTINPNSVYENKGDWFSPLSEFKPSIPLVECDKARTALTQKGFYGPGYTNSACDKTKKNLATGNWLNFYLTYDGLVGKQKKIDITKKVITNFLETVDGVRIGVMIFTPDPDGDGPKGADGGKVISWIKSVNEGTNRQKLINDVNAIVNECGTPLGKTLYEAGLYFQGAPSYFNAPLDYKNYYPIQYSCQKNFAIFMTDGMATTDDDEPSPLPSKIGDYDGDKKEPPVGSDKSHYLDDVAKYLYDRDLSSTLEGKQNLVTYTIGFDFMDEKFVDLLTRTAMHGHGKYYTSSNAVSLAVAFTNIVNEISEKTSSYVAPVVPVSKMERSTAGDKIYLAFFMPKQGAMWSGNIKKYGVQQTDDTSKGLVVGDLLDVSGSKALDSNGEFYPASKSYWTTSSSDGGEVERGGVAEVLRNRNFASNPRKIYTNLGTDSNLTNSSNAFAKTNSSITAALLGLSTTDDRDKLIDFIHGIDSWDDNLNRSTTDKRDWLLGSFVHSRPYVLHYSGKTVIYAGSNDGMLHAFDDSNGEELWAFIPRDFLGRLIELHSLTPGLFVDGSPKPYLTYDGDGKINKAYLIFGLRRGGNKYYALDVTNPEIPIFKWKIDPDTMPDYAEMGQSWSTPVIGKVKIGTDDKWVAFIGGGYDNGQDQDMAPPDDRGRAIYVVDVETGSLVKRFSFAENSEMTYSIPSDITRLDYDGDGRVDRLYVGDMNARMWRFDIGDLNKDGVSNTNEWTGKMIFASNQAEKRKIFYPPDVTFEKGYELLFFGTGNRENPKGSNDIDRLYAVKDRNSGTLLREGDLVDVTPDLLQESLTDQAIKDQILSDLVTKGGWFIKLDKQTGEKCLSTPIVFSKTAYYTTFSPTFPKGDTPDPCFIGEGVARLYALEYTTGNAAFNLDLLNDVGGVVVKRDDRSTVIGSAIPSGTIITIIGNKAVGYVGVGGGVFTPQLMSTKVLFPIYWKVVF